MPTLIEYALSGYYPLAGTVGYVGGLTCKPKSAGGIRRAWVGDRDSFGIWRLEQTSPLQYARISGSSKQGVWYPLYPVWQQATYTEAEEGMPTRGYVETLNLPYCRMDAPHRDTFERLAMSNKAVFLAEDLNGNCWLFGEHDGCLVQTSFDSQAATGTGTYSLQAVCRQTFPLRQLSAAYLNFVKGFVPATDINPVSVGGTTLIALVNVQAQAILSLLR